MNIDEKIENSPIMRFIPFENTGVFSPWPKRLMGFEKWEKAKRDACDILNEYNDGWYRSLLEHWKSYSAKFDPNGTNPATMLRFFYQVVKLIAKEVDNNKTVYGSGMDNYLFSLGEQFVVGDLILGTIIHSKVIVRYTDEYLSKYSVRTIVETGCGSGVNLFNLFCNLEVDRIVGGDMCANAITLANSIAKTYAIPGDFFLFDYDDKGSLKLLTKELKDYLLLTCQSVEQTQLSKNRFIEKILNLPNPPSIVLHFEPILWDDQSLMGQLCRQYAEINKYNNDLLETLLKYHREKRLEIVECRKRCFGASAFNPISLVSWKPCQ